MQNILVMSKNNLKLFYYSIILDYFPRYTKLYVTNYHCVIAFVAL